MNSRCGTPTHHTYPDRTVNTYGRKLLLLCQENDLVFINGLIYGNKLFDTNFRYLRGTSKSQNDWPITNSVDTIDSFYIITKLKFSDHTPMCHSDVYHSIYSTKTRKAYSLTNFMINQICCDRKFYFIS